MKRSHLLYVAGSALLINACGTTNTSNPKPGNGYTTIEKSYLSTTVKPTDDFFTFANENWIKNNPVPPSESRWGSFNELDKANKLKLTGILEEAQKNGGAKGSQDQLLGDYYTSFINMDQRDKLGINAIREEINMIQSIPSKKDLVTTIGQLHTLGIDVLFGFGVGQDLKDVEHHICYFSQGGIGLPNKEYYFDDSKKEILEKYHQHVQNIFKMAGLEETANAEALADVVLNFETKLASKMLAPAEMRIPERTYNKYSRTDLASAMGDFYFEGYLKVLDYPAFDTVVVTQIDYAKQLSGLVQEESFENWKTYLTWCVLNHYAGHLSTNFEKVNFQFYGEVLSGKKEMKPINERAIDEITGQSFGELLGKAFVEKYFSEEAKNRVDNMVDNLLAVYEERINNLEWMSATTKKEATIKLKAIGRKLGFPSKWEDFSSLNFSADAYVANLREVARYDFNENRSKLNEEVDKDKWEMPAHMVNAYYHPLLNEIAFPAGIMQPPFFDNNAEDAVNYGRIGMVIGHEFTHGFDDMGSKFAADGSFRNWWQETDRESFEAKTNVLGETFSAFCPIEGHCVNPDLTMGENIADLGGLTMAYYAYTRTDEFKKGEVREGFTPAQRFFIAYAQLWKINYTDAELKKRIATDPHSPGMYRVNGPLKNCPEFFEAFDVKPGDPMRNPEAKVARIW